MPYPAPAQKKTAEEVGKWGSWTRRRSSPSRLRRSSTRRRRSSTTGQRQKAEGERAAAERADAGGARRRTEPAPGRARSGARRRPPREPAPEPRPARRRRSRRRECGRPTPFRADRVGPDNQPAGGSLGASSPPWSDAVRRRTAASTRTRSSRSCATCSRTARTALVLAGTTGEGATLTDDEKLRLFELAVSRVRRRPRSSPARARTTPRTRST